MAELDSLIKSAPAVSAGDTIARAAGLIRASEGSRVLAVDDGHIAGTVSEQAIAAFLAAADDTEKALGEPVRALIERYPTFANLSMSLQQAAQVFAASGLDMLPVIDEYAGYRGVIYRRDVVGLMTRNLRPPTVAGMATPLGVYLTSGAHSGGAGSVGLFLTGVTLGLLMIASILIVDGAQRLFAAATGIPIGLFLASPPLTLRPNIYDFASYASVVLQVVAFLGLLRLSPLSGYHAAEHMTVHAIESGEALTPETVRRMPRVHPRCGTNLLAAAGVFIIITAKAGSQLTVLLALVVVVLGWRAVGGWLQYLVTTRPPSQRQLASAVAAGKELLDRYQRQPNRQAVGFDRVWSMGFLQTALGMGFVLTVLSILQSLFNIPMLI